MSAELVIRGGTVFDGSGAPGRAADVAIAGGVIREIGPKLRGGRELDASGCAVAPGFIDIHTHYDAQVTWDPLLESSCWHGITTVVMGTEWVTALATSNQASHRFDAHLQFLCELFCSQILSVERHRHRKLDAPLSGGRLDAAE